jgi:GTPase SAR1 family protein
MNDVKHIYKLIVIGNSDIGKSTLYITYCYGNFHYEKSHTIGVSYLTKRITDNS